MRPSPTLPLGFALAATLATVTTGCEALGRLFETPAQRAGRELVEETRAHEPESMRLFASVALPTGPGTQARRIAPRVMISGDDVMLDPVSPLLELTRAQDPVVAAARGVRSRGPVRVAAATELDTRDMLLAVLRDALADQRTFDALVRDPDLPVELDARPFVALGLAGTERYARLTHLAFNAGQAGYTELDLLVGDGRVTIEMPTGSDFPLEERPPTPPVPLDPSSPVGALLGAIVEGIDASPLGIVNDLQTGEADPLKLQLEHAAVFVHARADGLHVRTYAGPIAPSCETRAEQDAVTLGRVTGAFDSGALDVCFGALSRSAGRDAAEVWVVVSAAPAERYDAVVSVLLAARRAGFERLALALEPE